MDGKKGTPGEYYNDWLGFQGVDMEATIELAVPTNISTVKIGLCHEPNDWVMWPKSVWVCFSYDGKEFTDIPGANGLTFTYVADTENQYYIWKAIVKLVTLTEE